MDVFLMIRRKKLTIFIDANENTTIHELKKMLEGILKIPPNNQQLFNKDNTILEDSHMLQHYGVKADTAKAQSPAMFGLAIRDDNGTFEILDLVPYSTPPDLPDVMKSQENNGQE
ncbi:elongin-B-like [Rhynchophorus ferrugineus]|uniref:Ubiquitin-like domain-containing protein n=1 Tax=Rhynchophorus ferrugineus TaxID=354439 RepID=A0A834MF21_RHYFE|nr:hypothetical protein GWI33_004982 [Rhynchophorus ferrugineus]